MTGGSMLGADGTTQLRAIVSASPLLAVVIERWDGIALPDCWLVAGAVAQTVWNDCFGLPFAHGISDIDLAYFDPDDLSEDGEARHAARTRELFSDLAVRIDVKNEARVHLWYEAKFGYAIRPYASVADAITTFPTTATAVGLQPQPEGLAIFAPFGLADLLGGVVRPNKEQITRAIYEAKVARWTAMWPKLNVVAWDAVGA